MRDYALRQTKGNSSVFHTMHIRQGDFQRQFHAGSNEVTAEQIYENVKEELADGSIVFIATDEEDKSFFNPLRRHFDIRFLDDFMSQLNPNGFPRVNTNYFGLVDQLVVRKEGYCVMSRRIIESPVALFCVV
jgi:GDP-fucose protein O-fucosyltransferase